MINFIDKKDLPATYLQIAKICKTKNVNLAVLFYTEKMITSFPQNIAALVLQTRAYYDQKNYRQALSSTQECLQILEKSAKEEDKELIAELLSYEIRCRIFASSSEDTNKQIKNTLDRLSKLKPLKLETQDMISRLENEAAGYLKQGIKVKQL